MLANHLRRRDAALAAALAQALLCGQAYGSDHDTPPPAATQPYVVLSKTQAIFYAVCSETDTAAVTDDSHMTYPVSLKGLHSSVFPNQRWTLLTLGKDQNSIQGEFHSGKKYTLTINLAGGKPEQDCLAQPITIDTTPGVTYIPDQQPNEGGKFYSLAAFSLLGSDKPVNFIAPDCGPPLLPGATCVDVVVELHGAQIHLRKLQVMEVDQKRLAKGEIDYGGSIGTIGVNSVPLRASLRGTRPNDKKGGSFVNLSYVLVGTSNDPLTFTEGPLTVGKAPATKDLSWLWINGTVTAGTGAAPAWVLDGKIDSPSKQFPPSKLLPGPVLLKWANATANVGNNKINGQAAKDVIDFSALSTTWFHEDRAFLIYVYTFYATIILPVEGRQGCNHIHKICGIACCGHWGAENVRRRLRGVWKSAAFGFIRCGTGSRRQANAPAFRSAVIAVRAWLRWNPCCAPGSNKSPI